MDNTKIVGFLRGLAVVAVFALLNYVGDISHLTGVFTPYIATLISGLALMLEHSIEQKSGKALFGAVRTK